MHKIGSIFPKVASTLIFAHFSTTEEFFEGSKIISLLEALDPQWYLYPLTDCVTPLAYMNPCMTPV